MEGQIVKITPLTKRERSRLQKEMRRKHGAVKEILDITGLHRPRLYEAVAGDKISLDVLNKIRTFLNQKQTA